MERPEPVTPELFRVADVMRELTMPICRPQSAKMRKTMGGKTGLELRSRTF